MPFLTSPVAHCNGRFFWVFRAPQVTRKARRKVAA